MMIYDAFVRRVISSNKQVFNKLASIMMLLRKNTFKKVKVEFKSRAQPNCVSELLSHFAHRACHCVR